MWACSRRGACVVWSCVYVHVGGVRTLEGADCFRLVLGGLQGCLLCIFFNLFVEHATNWYSYAMHCYFAVCCCLMVLLDI